MKKNLARVVWLGQSSKISIDERNFGNNEMMCVMFSPLPIPNREVKPVSADGAASWESKSFLFVLSNQ